MSYQWIAPIRHSKEVGDCDWLIAYRLISANITMVVVEEDKVEMLMENNISWKW